MNATTRIDVLVYPGFDELDAVGPFEVLRAAELEGVPLRVRLVARQAPEAIVASHGLVLSVATRLDVADPPDWLVVPGGGWRNRAEVGTWGEAQRGELPALLRELAAVGTKFASVCTGAMLLATAGITAGRPATTHAVARDELQESGAKLVNARVVDDEDLITAGGVTSGLDLALRLLERIGGADAADAGALRMEYERQGMLWTRSGLRSLNR